MNAEKPPYCTDTRSPIKGWGAAFLAAFGLALSLFLFYFAVYRVRGYDLPIGFDAPWYVWRAQFVADAGLGPLGTNFRPGHALLSSLLGSVTGRSQLQLAVLLPLLLVSVFALALGGFWREAIDRSPWGWLVPVAVSGTLLGTTRLVGENVANLLLLALAVAALVPLARRVGGRSGFWGSISLLIAAGLAHWLFLAVVLAILLTAAAFGLPESQRARRAGVRPARTETGAVVSVVAVVAAGMVGLILGILRSPFRTFEIEEDPGRLLPKLRTDLRRLVPPLVAPPAIAGAVDLLRTPRTVSRSAEDWGRDQGRGFALRVLAAWTLVGAAGIAFGAISLDLPPHRFLALVVAIPGATCIAAGIALVARGLARGAGGGVATATVAAFCFAGVSAVAAPGALSWYREGPGLWIDESALREASAASAYVESLPDGQPVVFVVGPFGLAGTLSVPLKERIIRVGLGADRQEDLHVFVGEPEDALAGRRSVIQGEATNRAVFRYWVDVREVLPLRPPILVLRALAGPQFADAVGELGAPELAPGVALLRGAPIVGAGTAAPIRVASATLPRAVPTIEAGLAWAAALLILLSLAGLGWTRVFLGREVPPAVFVCTAPAVGAAVLILGALLATTVGVPLGGPGGIATYVVITGGGLSLSLFRPSARLH